MKTRKLFFMSFVLLFAVLLFWQRSAILSLLNNDPLARCLRQGLTQKQCLCLNEKIKERITPQVVLKLRKDLEGKIDPSGEMVELFAQLKRECVGQ